MFKQVIKIDYVRFVEKNLNFCIVYANMLYLVSAKAENKKLNKMKEIYDMEIIECFFCGVNYASKFYHLHAIY